MLANGKMYCQLNDLQCERFHISEVLILVFRLMFFNIATETNACVVNQR